MAGERAFIWCPLCDKNGVNNEIVREDNVVFKCGIGHTFNYDSLMASKPRMIRMELVRKPNVGDVKTEVWINGEALNKFNQLHPGQLDATLDNIIRQHCDGDLVIIDGMQAREMGSLGVNTGAQMLAAIKNAKTLEAEIATKDVQLATIQGLFAKMGVESPV